jgi:hypothetical protein
LRRGARRACRYRRQESHGGDPRRAGFDHCAARASRPEATCGHRTAPYPCRARAVRSPESAALTLRLLVESARCRTEWRPLCSVDRDQRGRYAVPDAAAPRNHVVQHPVYRNCAFNHSPSWHNLSVTIRRMPGRRQPLSRATTERSGFRPQRARRAGVRLTVRGDGVLSTQESRFRRALGFEWYLEAGVGIAASPTNEAWETGDGHVR